MSEHIRECPRFAADVLPDDYQGHDALLRNLFPICECDHIRAHATRLLTELRGAVELAGPSKPANLSDYSKGYAAGRDEQNMLDLFRIDQLIAALAPTH